MAYFGPQFAGYGNQNMMGGQAAIQNALGGLLQNSQQDLQRSFQQREAEKQRRFQEEQQKKAEKDLFKRTLTQTGINVGTGALAGGIAGAAFAPGEVAAVGGASGVPMGGMAGAAIPAATANAVNPLLTMSAGRAATTGALLGGLGGLSGQNYAAPFISGLANAPMQAAQLANIANDNAYRWSQLSQQREINEADNAAAMERARLMADTRNTGYDVARERITAPYVYGPTPYQEGMLGTRNEANRIRGQQVQGNLDLGNRRADIAGRGMDLRGDALAQNQAQFEAKFPLEIRRTQTGERNAESYAKGAETKAQGGGVRASVNAKGEQSISGTPESIERYRMDKGFGPSDPFENTIWRASNTLNEGGDPESVIAFAVKEKTITPQQADKIRETIRRYRGG